MATAANLARFAYAPAEGCDTALNHFCQRNCNMGQLTLARIGGPGGHGKWRCYTLHTLSADTMQHIGGADYCTREDQLLAELARCKAAKSPPPPPTPLMPKPVCASGCSQARCDRFSMYVEQLHAVFVHIPKTGGTSIEAGTLGLQTCAVRKHPPCGSDHSTAAEFIACNTALYNALPSFAILRHPLGRVRSLYQYCLDGGNGSDGDLRKCMWVTELSKTHGIRNGFEAFVDELRVRSKWEFPDLGRSQRDFVMLSDDDDSGGEKLAVSFVLCLEHLEDDWAKWVQPQVLALRNVSVPPAIRTSTPWPELDQPSPRTLHLVHEDAFYAKDLQLWKRHCERTGKDSNYPPANVSPKNAGPAGLPPASPPPSPQLELPPPSSPPSPQLELPSPSSPPSPQLELPPPLPQPELPPAPPPQPLSTPSPSPRPLPSEQTVIIGSVVVSLGLGLFLAGSMWVWRFVVKVARRKGYAVAVNETCTEKRDLNEGMPKAWCMPLWHILKATRSSRRGYAVADNDVSAVKHKLDDAAQDMIRAKYDYEQNSDYEGSRGQESLLHVEWTADGTKQLFEGQRGHERLISKETPVGSKHFYEGPAGQERKIRIELLDGEKLFFEGDRSQERRVCGELPNGNQLFFEGPRGQECKVREELPDGIKLFYEGPKGQERKVREEFLNGGRRFFDGPKGQEHKVREAFPSGKQRLFYGPKGQERKVHG